MAYSVVRARPNPRKRRGDNDEVDWEEEMPKRGAYEAAVMGDTPDVPSASTAGGEGDAQEGFTSTTAFPPRDFGWNASTSPQAVSDAPKFQAAAPPIIGLTEAQAACDAAVGGIAVARRPTWCVDCNNWH